MIKAMIIDDEKLIREGLVTYIDWAALGVEVCAVCGDCAGAVPGRRPAPSTDHSGRYLPARRQRSGAVPANPGLRAEMRGHLHQQLLGIPVRQQAVKLGAFDYLLKPIEADVLYDCVRRCAEKIRSTKDPGGQNCDRTVVEKILTDALTNVPQADQTFLHLARPGGRARGQPPVPAGIRNRRSSGCGVVSWHWSVSRRRRSGRF